MGAVLSMVAVVAGLTISSFCRAPAAGEPSTHVASVVRSATARVDPVGESGPAGSDAGVGRGAAVSPWSVPAAADDVYSPPVPTPFRVVRGFDAPTSPFAAGHRGVDLAASQGEVVTAAAAGVVRFAGPVAGRALVVLSHPDGITTEYEPVQASVHVGEVVAAGEPVGKVDGSHGTCGDRCLHWGARRDEVYIDPLSLLRPLGTVRLLPCC